MRRVLRRFWLLAFCLIMLGCSSPPAESTPGAAQPFTLPSPQAVPPTFTPGPVPTLPTPSPSATRPPQVEPASTAETPIPFEDTVVELRYQIPALGLDRRLQGNVASQIILIDETTGNGQQRENQAGILLQLQQALKDLTLPPVPEGCEQCVQLTFELPLADLSGSGWLQDVTMLASVENYMTVTLGPHFPPDTVLGLRRSASPFAPAQTLALLPDGRLWIWQANYDTIPDPQVAGDELVLAAAALSDTRLERSYVANCEGAPVEDLLIGVDPVRQVSIICPQYSLPSTLLPLYTLLDARMTAQLTDNLPQPETGMPLTALLDFDRQDGAALTLFADGTAVAVDQDQTVFTTTLGVTEVLSVTTRLVASGEMATGLTSFRDDLAESAVSRLLVRGETDIWDALWIGGEETAVYNEVNTLLQSIATPADPDVTTPEPAEDTPEPTPTP